MKNLFKLFFFFLSFCAFSQNNSITRKNNQENVTTNKINSNSEVNQFPRLLQNQNKNSNFFYVIDDKPITTLELYYNLKSFFLNDPLVLIC